MIETAARSQGIRSPRFWTKLTEVQGIIVQLAGTVGGVVLMIAAGAIKTMQPLSVALMLIGFVAIYLCTHSLAHWAVGRLVGLRFDYIGMRGTDHPENYPPGLRHLMSVLPMFTSVSTKESRARAGRLAIAAYFAAGETSTTVFSILAALLALRLGVPGAQWLLIIMVVYNAAATVTTALIPKGDYAKALRALRPAR